MGAGEKAQIRRANLPCGKGGLYAQGKHKSLARGLLLYMNNVKCKYVAKYM